MLLSRCWPTLRALFLLVPTSQRFGIVLFCFLSSSVLAARAVLSTLISECCVGRSVNSLGRSMLSSLRNFIFHWRLAERFYDLSSTLFGLKSWLFGLSSSSWYMSCTSSLAGFLCLDLPCLSLQHYLSLRSGRVVVIFVVFSSLLLETNSFACAFLRVWGVLLARRDWSLWVL